MSASFLGILEQYAALFERMLAGEEQKCSALSRRSYSELEAAIRRDESFSLELRSLEQKRRACQARLNAPDATIRQLASLFPRELSPRAEELSARLARLYADYRACSASNRRLLELRLHSIDVTLARARGCAPDTASILSGRG